MPLKKLLTFVVICASMNSCFITNQIFEEEEKEEDQLNIQAEAEKNAAAYIRASLEDNKYKPYGFSKLKILKPLALVELEKLEKQIKLAPSDSSLYTEIEAKKAYIKANNIERTAKLDHFFVLTQGDSSGINVLEATYTFNDTLGVIDVTPTIVLEVPKYYEFITDYYANEYTIFIAESYVEGRKMSNKFYEFFKDQLETQKTIGSKSRFLKHTLDICLLIKATGKFDQDIIAQCIFQGYVREERNDITEYEALDFSELYETKNNTDNSLVGYYFFHKFIGNYNDQKDTNVVLVEFSPYYEVGQVFQMENSFESYTNQVK